MVTEERSKHQEVNFVFGPHILRIPTDGSRRPTGTTMLEGNIACLDVKAGSGEKLLFQLFLPDQVTCRVRQRGKLHSHKLLS